MTSRPFVAGNWKMNGLASDLREVEAIRTGIAGDLQADVMICPPLTLLAAAVRLLIGSTAVAGAQDCAATRSGAHTGDISAAMLKDAGAAGVILGHSERRIGHGETDAAIRAKVAAALEAGLTAIVCVGETESEKTAGATLAVCARQLLNSLPPNASPANTVVAYEPVWAIGSGSTPSRQEIEDVHNALRQAAGTIVRAGAQPHDEPRWRIVYGGSVTPSNAAEIFAAAGVDGALAGGASLRAAPFLEIIEAAHRRGARL